MYNNQRPARIALPRQIATSLAKDLPDPCVRLPPRAVMTLN